MDDIYISKVWAMPNGNTFTIKPIKKFVEIEVNKGGVIVDPLRTVVNMELLLMI